MKLTGRIDASSRFNRSILFFLLAKQEESIEALLCEYDIVTMCTSFINCTHLVPPCEPILL